MDVLDELLTSRPERAPVANLEAWLDTLSRCPHDRSIDRALWAGFEADRLGYAFVGGYGAALDHLFEQAAIDSEPNSRTWPSPPLAKRLSLCATEKGGAHPRAIATELTEKDGSLRVSGEKTFATLATLADELLVVASRGRDERGMNRLCIVRIPSGAEGVRIQARDPTPFAPEIPHAIVTLEDVVVREDDVLPGDGYDVYLKPFRTIEDAHVLASALAYVLRVARLHRFRSELVETAYAIVVGLSRLAEMDPRKPSTHIALAGLFGSAHRVFGDLDREWEKTDAETRDRFRRDAGLLLVAEAVRQKRAEAAWKTLHEAKT